MGIFDAFVTASSGAALSQAEWLERRFGPNGGLPAYYALRFTPDPEVRRRARLGTIRCQVQLNLASDVITEATLWSDARGGAHLDEIIDLCKTLVARGHAAAAAALAEAEVTRDPKARACYLHARCLERARDPASMEALRLTAERAAAEPGAEEIGVTARVRRIERLAADPATLKQAIAEAQEVDVERATGPQKLVIAAARLASSSRFARAAGLSLLEEVAKKARAELADAAVRMAAEHADVHADALTPVEVDRIAAVLKHWRDAKERESLLLRLHSLTSITAAQGEALARALVDSAEVAPENRPLLRRAQALSEGGAGEAAPSGELPPDLALVGLGLDVIAALRRGKPDDAAVALAKASMAQKGRGGAAPAALWTGIGLSLRSPERGVQQGAINLLEAIMSAPSAPPPPPFVKLSALGALLRLLGRADLAESALRGAAAAKEPGAAAELAAGLCRQGWALAGKGDREGALAALREAKSLYSKARPAGAGKAG